MQLNITGGKQRRARTHTCVLFDPKSGQIQHMHTVTTLGRIKAATEDEVEHDAYRLAKEGGRDVRGTKALHLHDADLRPYVTYRVDVKKAALVEDAVFDDLKRPRRRS